AGLVDGFFKIDQVMATLVNPPGPVVVDMAVTGQVEQARVANRVLTGAQARVQRGETDEWLDRGTGRIAGQRTIEQRGLPAVVEFRIVCLADAGNEQVGIEGRLADHRQHSACGGVEGYDAAAMLPQRRGGRDLQLAVEM